VPFAVDAAQTAGVLPIDMAECNIDFLCFTGHKALFGPTGTGGICVADDAEIRGTIYGGTGIGSAVPYHLEEYPYRLEAGTLNLAGIAGLCAGLDWIEQTGLKNIHQREIGLLGMLQEGLSEIRGVTMRGTRNLERRVATMSMTVANIDAEDVGTILDTDYNIQTRTGLHCAPLIHAHHRTAPRGTVRFSIGAFNNEESAVPYHLEEYPYRLEAGTLNLAGIAGLSAGLDWIEQTGLENIHQREIGLLGMLQEGLSEIRDVTIRGTRNLERRVATMSMTVANIDAEDVGTILDTDYNIQTRTGLHCAPLIHEHHRTSPRGTVRFSIGAFNTEQHIESAIRAVAAIAADRS